MLFLLLACASTAEKADTADATGGSSLGGGETADDTQSDTDPVDDTGGDADFTHYMSVTAGTFTTASGETVPCVGEAHLNHYPADGRLMGFCGCASDDDRLVLTGFIEATVTEGQIVGSWAAEDGDQSLSATVQGALDATTLHATLSGNADWIAFTGEVDGTYP